MSADESAHNRQTFSAGPGTLPDPLVEGPPKWLVKSPIPLGIGAYSRPLSGTSTHFVRMAFLSALDTDVPHVRASLRPLIEIPDGPSRDAALAAWAGKQGLLWQGKAPRWVVQTARATLRAWMLNPDLKGWVYAPSLDWEPMPETDPRKTIEVSFDPFLETEEAAGSRAYAAIERHFAAMKDAAKSAGGLRTAVKNEPAHLHWLARYLANRETPQAILASLKNYAGTVPSIKQAIRETARLVGLDLPPFPVVGKRGRPRRKLQSRRTSH